MNEGVTLQQVVAAVSSGSLATVLVLIIWMGSTKRWVFGWLYEQERQDKEAWKQLALTGMREQSRAVAVADRSARVLEVVATTAGKDPV